MGRRGEGRGEREFVFAIGRKRKVGAYANGISVG